LSEELPAIYCYIWWSSSLGCHLYKTVFSKNGTGENATQSNHSKH